MSMEHIKVKGGKMDTRILKETLTHSILADLWGYSCLGGLFWFNYNFIGGSYIVNTIILIMIAVKIGKFMCPKSEYTIDETIAYLEEMKKDKMQ